MKILLTAILMIGLLSPIGVHAQITPDVCEGLEENPEQCQLELCEVQNRNLRDSRDRLDLPDNSEAFAEVDCSAYNQEIESEQLNFVPILIGFVVLVGGSTALIFYLKNKG